MVPGSTLMYGSSLMLVTRMLRDSRIAARDAAAMPFPSEETTPPVTKTNLVMYFSSRKFLFYPMLCVWAKIEEQILQHEGHEGFTKNASTPVSSIAGLAFLRALR